MAAFQKRRDEGVIHVWGREGGQIWLFCRVERERNTLWEPKLTSMRAAEKRDIENGYAISNVSLFSVSLLNQSNHVLKCVHKQTRRKRRDKELHKEERLFYSSGELTQSVTVSSNFRFFQRRDLFTRSFPSSLSRPDFPATELTLSLFLRDNDIVCPSFSYCPSLKNPQTSHSPFKVRKEMWMIFSSLSNTFHQFFSSFIVFFPSSIPFSILVKVSPDVCLDKRVSRDHALKYLD